MVGQVLPPEATLLRYIKPSLIDGDDIDGEAFLEKYVDGPSVNWLDQFAVPVENQVSEVRARKRIQHKLTGKLALANHGKIREAVAQFPDIVARHDPLEPSPPEHPIDDPSHSVLCGVPVIGSDEAHVVGDLIVGCVAQLFPTVE
jgi:hypothetical protein